MGIGRAKPKNDGKEMSLRKNRQENEVHGNRV